MATPQARSVNAELHIGCHEGGHEGVGKDWGGSTDLRSCPPMAASAETGHEALDPR
jgi:hypothetical protein